MDIRVTVGDSGLTGQLWDNATAKDLLSLLPLTLTFRDFNQVEKLARLPRELSLAGMPARDDPVPGEIGYYAPSGDLVFYYRDVGYFTGIMRIGHVDGGIDALARQTTAFSATITIAP